MRLLKGAALALLAASVIAIPTARALSVIPPTFQELVSKADSVIDGEVTALRSQVEDYQGQQVIYTYVTVRVLEVVKGQAGETLELRLLGGTVGDQTMEVSGTPKFAVGERALLFVEGNGKMFFPLVAVTHGLYPIVHRSADGAEVVLRSNGAPLRAAADVSNELHGLAAAERGKAAADNALTLADFKKQIRAEVAHARQQ